MFLVLPLSVLISYKALVTSVGDYMAGAHYLEPLSCSASQDRTKLLNQIEGIVSLFELKLNALRGQESRLSS